MSLQMYDIIGDIHGHADELIKLLKHLGYIKSRDGYYHNSRKVIFLGDFIDRGDELVQHRSVLKIVMDMVKHGSALAVMGNHEFNALAYHTEHKGHFLRPHTDKNKKQHQAFLNEFPGDSKEKSAVLDFFFSLPLWLEVDGLRVVHACWDTKHIELMKSLCPSHRLDQALLVEASTSGTPVFIAVEVLLKGFEYNLPAGIHFFDKDKNMRTAVRMQWWNSAAHNVGEVVLPNDLDIGNAKKLPLPVDMPKYKANEPPCFIGHYWLDGEPKPLADNVACVDYSVAEKGKLVAYRWDGEKKLDQSRFTYADA